MRAASYATARIVKDVDGSLARMLAQVQVPHETIAASWEQARAGIEGAIGSLLYLSLHNARGAVWSAMGEISSCGAEVYTLLALLRGRETFGFRYVEQLLPPTEREMLRTAWPREATAKKCAARHAHCGAGRGTCGGRPRTLLGAPWRSGSTKLGC